MLNALIRFSLSQRALVLAGAVVLLVFGLKTVLELPVDVLPDLTKPTVTLLTEAPGYAAEEVETLVTIPLENALMGVTGVTRLRSVNDVSLSLIFVEFDWDTDIDQARVHVQQRLAGISAELPGDIQPYMTPATSLMGDILMIGVRDATGEMAPRDVRAIADWTIAQRVRSVRGVAEVVAMGGGIKQIQIQPKPDQMRLLGIDIEQLRAAAAQSVDNSTGGFLTERSQEIMVRNLAMTTDLDDIASTVVSMQGDRPVRLGDVANITWDIEPMRGDAGLGVNPETQIPKSRTPNSASRLPHPASRTLQPASGAGVILNIRKSPGVDSIRLTAKVQAVLDEIQATLPPGIEIVTLYRQGDFIDLAIHNLKEALLWGVAMVSIVLLLFLLNLRQPLLTLLVTAITLTAIPLSMAITVLAFKFMGLSVNAMTLGGLAVAIGLVVDDAIVDVENVNRRLRENAARPEPLPRLEVIARASSEVRSSIFYATVLIILVFIPLLALSGVAGRLFSPIAIATMISMASSFVVSLTVIPVLSSFLLHPKPGRPHRDSFLVRGLKWIFLHTWLRFALSQPMLLALITVVLFAASLFALTRMGGNFLPAFREPTVVIAMATAPGTSLKTTTELSEAALHQLLQIPGVKTVGYRVGRAERGDHVVPVSTVEFDVEFDDSREREELLTEMRATMKTIPGTFSAFSGPLADRIGHMLSGVSAKVAVKIYGPELSTLRRLGTEVAEVASAIPGLEEARLEQQASVPQLRIEIDRKRALAYGVTPGDLNREIAGLIGGETVAKVYEGVRSYDLVVRLPLEWRENPAKLDQLYIDTQSGQRIPLSYVANLRMATGPNTILRENTQRRFVVSINPTISDLNTAVQQLERDLAANITLPQGYSLALEGEYQAQQEARRVITLGAGLILLVIIFLLTSYFRSVLFVFMVLTIVPVSLIGAVLFTSLILNNISIATLVGFIAVAGISARNNIMMISHYLHLMRNEGERFSRSMIIRGTLERLVPVLMTALSAGIALVPLVLSAGEPGKEILTPVAVVIIGGLLSSTLLELAITPCLFYFFCHRSAEHSVRVRSAASG